MHFRKLFVVVKIVDYMTGRYSFLMSSQEELQLSISTHQFHASKRRNERNSRSEIFPQLPRMPHDVQLGIIKHDRIRANQRHVPLHLTRTRNPPTLNPRRYFPKGHGSLDCCFVRWRIGCADWAEKGGCVGVVGHLLHDAVHSSLESDGPGEGFSFFLCVSHASTRQLSLRIETSISLRRNSKRERKERERKQTNRLRASRQSWLASYPHRATRSAFVCSLSLLLIDHRSVFVRPSIVVMLRSTTSRVRGTSREEGKEER